MNKKKISLSLNTNINILDGNDIDLKYKDNKEKEVIKSIDKVEKELKELNEKVNLLEIKDNSLVEIKNYFEGRNSESDLSYEW